MNNKTLQEATRLVNNLLDQYKNYQKISKNIELLKTEQIQTAIRLGQLSGQTFAEILQTQPPKLQAVTRRTHQAMQKLQHISDSMTFANPIVWMMYKYRAYAGTSQAITDMEDLRNHCRPNGYICSSRYHFLKNHLATLRLDLDDLTRYPSHTSLPHVYSRPEFITLVQNPQIMADWTNYEYHTSAQQQVAKWQNYTPLPASPSIK